MTGDLGVLFMVGGVEEVDVLPEQRGHAHVKEEHEHAHLQQVALGGTWHHTFYDDRLFGEKYIFFYLVHVHNVRSVK